MKGSKDEEKVRGPLFPRLHINDAEKGGPKAPPRNKMALYEQLSTPTQRFTSGSSIALPLSHKDTRHLVPSSSSIHHKKSAHSTFGNVPAPHLAERQQSHKSAHSTFSNAPAPHLAERQPSHKSVGANMNTSSTNRTGQLKLTTQKDSSNLPMAAHYSYFQPHNCSNSRNTSTKRLRDENDCRVPAFVRLENTRSTVDEPQKNDGFGSLKLRHLKSTSGFFPKHHTSIEGSTILTCEKNTQNPTTFSGNKVELLEVRNRLGGERKVLKKTEVSEKSTKGYSENINEKSFTCTLEIERDDQSYSKECGDLQLAEVEKDEKIKEACNVESVTGVKISPDTVVEAIGQKQFWKTRRALVHQQKVFAVQVFELHRLIKVQKLFAESPELLMENNFFLPKKPSIYGSPEKNLRLENIPEPPPVPPQPKDTPQISNLISDTNKGINNLLSNYKPYLPTNPKPSPWCFPSPPPGNQWLVPVMSPSEGLIYKPYSGPCPPTTAIPGPVLSGPMGPTPPVTEDYLRFGFFPPYCVPSLNHSKMNDKAHYPSSFSSYSIRNLVAESKESEIHASTASSPDINFRANALPLFPTAPTAIALDKSDKTQNSMNHTHVIKVVPHNARSASASAARIFRSIQEERRQHG